ncbi:MAG: enoyl-CoA hydratase/isomerase family protein [Planctomycetes bacterium]|nr:enoyl-CoA hydratase/isomerase family protein [Planctomycetota bacterium]
MIQRETYGDVLVVRLQHGKVNALDLELLEAIAATFEELARSAGGTVVLTGTGSAFSAGVDLKRIVEGGASYAERFLPALDRAFESVLAFPRPLVAAVNGHAVAGGCILALACDRRVLARGKLRIGAPELRVGVAWPALALEILRSRVHHAQLREIVYAGAAYPPEEALARGFADELAEPEQVLPRALELARDLASLPPNAFRLAKAQAAMPIRIACAASAEREAEVRADWASPATRERLARYLEQLTAKK